jgi:Kef-type K+ transport system membrane component KefB
MVVSASAPPLAAQQLLVFLLQVAGLLLLALLLGRLAVRVRLPAIVGELLAGVLLGPSVLGQTAPQVADWLLPARPEQAHLLDAVGQIGVLLLVGITGAQFDARYMFRRRRAAVQISLGGLLLPLALGIVVGFLVPRDMVPDADNRVVFALFMGVAMCVTAIPVISKVLSDMNLMHRDVGQLTLAAGFVDDAVGWLLLSVVSAMATVGLRVGQVLLSMAYLVGFVLVAALIGRRLVAALLRPVAAGPEPGPATAAAVVIVLLCAAATQAMKMEPVFGAFVGGILVGWPGTVDTRLLAPLRAVVLSVLAPIFMATAGLRMDLTALADPRVAVTGLVVLLVAVVGKFAGAYAGARLSRLGHWEALALGAGMNARGVVEVVVALVGLRLGVLTTATYTIVVLVAIVTSLMAPPVLRLAVSRVEHNAAETLRLAEQDAWSVSIRR